MVMMLVLRLMLVVMMMTMDKTMMLKVVWDMQALLHSRPSMLALVLRVSHCAAGRAHRLVLPHLVGEEERRPGRRHQAADCRQRRAKERSQPAAAAGRQMPAARLTRWRSGRSSFRASAELRAWKAWHEARVERFFAGETGGAQGGSGETGGEHGGSGETGGEQGGSGETGGARRGRRGQLLVLDVSSADAPHALGAFLCAGGWLACARTNWVDAQPHAAPAPWWRLGDRHPDTACPPASAGKHTACPLGAAVAVHERGTAEGAKGGAVRQPAVHVVEQRQHRALLQAAHPPRKPGGKPVCEPLGRAPPLPLVPISLA